LPIRALKRTKNTPSRRVRKKCFEQVRAIGAQVVADAVAAASLLVISQVALPFAQTPPKAH